MHDTTKCSVGYILCDYVINFFLSPAVVGCQGPPVDTHPGTTKPYMRTAKRQIDFACCLAYLR